MMTLDEAIKHWEEIAEKNEEECKNWTYGASRINDDESRKKHYLKHAEMWKEYAKEHRQLAEWLRELKNWREFGENLGARLGEYLTEEQIKKLEGDAE